MELALVLVFVLLGTGTIVYAGLRNPARTLPREDAVMAEPGMPTGDQPAEGDVIGDSPPARAP